jgi:hypothetical protein
MSKPSKNKRQRRSNRHVVYDKELYLRVGHLALSQEHHMGFRESIPTAPTSMLFNVAHNRPEPAGPINPANALREKH